MTGSVVSGGLSGGSLSVSSIGLSAGTTQLNYFISVEGFYQSTSSSTPIYLARLIFPVNLIPSNTGPPVLTQDPPSKIHIFVNDFHMLSFSSIVDPDGDSYSTSIDFGKAQSFAIGTFPHYYINP